LDEITLILLFVLAMFTTIMGFMRRGLLWPLFTVTFWWSVYVATGMYEFAVAALFFTSAQVIAIVRRRR
jgi:hypothetical protein